MLFVPAESYYAPFFRPLQVLRKVNYDTARCILGIQYGTTPHLNCVEADCAHTGDKFTDCKVVDEAKDIFWLVEELVV